MTPPLARQHEARINEIERNRLIIDIVYALRGAAIESVTRRGGNSPNALWRVVQDAFRE